MDYLPGKTTLSARSLQALQDKCSDWVFGVVAEIPRVSKKERTSVGLTAVRVLMFGRMQGGGGSGDAKSRIDADVLCF